MVSWSPRHDQATIERAVRMVTGGEGRRKRTLREVAQELGVSHVAVHKWVYRTARQATTGQYNPTREHDREDSRQPSPSMKPTTVADAGVTGFLAGLVDHHRVECERLSRENAALMATVVLLARDLRDRQ